MKRDVESLQTELKRKERHLKQVTEQYERLLSEKNRKLSRERSGETNERWLLSGVVRYLRDR
ncbi:hypothetical protein AArcS_1109 [Natranaeroarchaeum sulfidigenes]|uniref:Uncharacterized protein n=1 Tax=Natranaeroarchaeum sulfidigenes TaxID=2784880 RepID=A0A897MTQ0_9EURY|nr:hypothetical protein AArcS_1109 [Natranaeroarchaeum sulfidigenes]